MKTTLTLLLALISLTTACQESPRAPGDQHVTAAPTEPVDAAGVAPPSEPVPTPVPPAVHAANEFGSFAGKVVAEWLSDGRRMKLLEPFSFIDATGDRWTAPAGSIVDGASIPQFAWAIIGGPFEGKYREASVIHDVACDQKLRPWQQVHKAFYHAMLANEVNTQKAKVMYAAVYHFGPRWERSTELRVMRSQGDAQMRIYKKRTLKGDRVELSTRPAPDPASNTILVKAIYKPSPSTLPQADFDVLAREIEARDLSLEEIENFSPPAP
ncbi:DUF1353 domain-containing protein [Lysobacter sp. P5_B9]